MNRKLYKAAYDRVLDKKYFFRHLIVFVMGNFVLFFWSLQSWTPAVFYLLTLIWIRVVALHFASAYPEVVKDFRFKNEAAVEKAIEKELKLLKKQQKEKKKLAAAQKTTAIKLPLKPIVAKEGNRPYIDSDLV